MDFESYIGKEKQLFARLDKERSSVNAYEKKPGAGNLDMAEDEIKLLRAGNIVKARIGEANAAMKGLDEKSLRIREAEENVEVKSAELVLRMSEWESGFNDRYRDLMGRVEVELKKLEARNNEFVAMSKEQESLYKARNDELAHNIEAAEKDIKAMREIAMEDVKNSIASLKEAQKEFEASVNEKLDQDKATIEKIKFMVSTMSDIIKM
jgi:hypothetical protein